MNLKLGSHKLMNIKTVWYKFYLSKTRILMAIGYNEFRVVQDNPGRNTMDLNKIQDPKAKVTYNDMLRNEVTSKFNCIAPALIIGPSISPRGMCAFKEVM
jgi:hypothetical protein